MEIVVHFPLAHHNAPSRAKHAMPLATRSFVRALLMSENETAPTGRAFPGRAFSLAELAARWAPMRKIDRCHVVVRRWSHGRGVGCTKVPHQLNATISKRICTRALIASNDERAINHLPLARAEHTTRAHLPRRTRTNCKKISAPIRKAMSAPVVAGPVI